jgi:GNAT superfamily N-acetyltransferase
MDQILYQVSAGSPSMTLRIGSIGPGDEHILTALFEGIASDPASKQFHPHPFTASEAHARAHYVGKDVYALMTFAEEGVGYGMLRGWDAGYRTPSLGMYIAREHRGTGASRLLMNYLHLAAKLKGAKSIRLKVYEDNARARRLYISLGYRFSKEPEKGQLVGICQL